MKAETRLVIKRQKVREGGWFCVLKVGGKPCSSCRRPEVTAAFNFISERSVVAVMKQSGI
jgi:hypothetical protein